MLIVACAAPRARWATFVAGAVALALGVGLLTTMGLGLASTLDPPERAPQRFAASPVVVMGRDSLTVTVRREPETAEVSKKLDRPQPVDAAVLRALRRLGPVVVRGGGGWSPASSWPRPVPGCRCGSGDGPGRPAETQDVHDPADGPDHRRGAPRPAARAPRGPAAAGAGRCGRAARTGEHGRLRAPDLRRRGTRAGHRRARRVAARFGGDGDRVKGGRGTRPDRRPPGRHGRGADRARAAGRDDALGDRGHRRLRTRGGHRAGEVRGAGGGRPGGVRGSGEAGGRGGRCARPRRPVDRRQRGVGAAHRRRERRRVARRRAGPPGCGSPPCSRSGRAATRRT
ncbi:hypothetical protein QFZ82_003735 [Streptomyces sp. V4I23]|nr:hypothetical protein [Streptomyces sp. V4I23]